MKSKQHKTTASLSNSKKGSSQKKHINLNYLKQISKKNPKMMVKIIEVYLEETPKLISIMKKSIDTKDWESLKTTAHSMIPSFSMMGINVRFEKFAKEIQQHATNLSIVPTKLIKETTAVIKELFLEIEIVCKQVYKELRKELLIL